jgi:acetyltransferase-like isoleucine patch superfamily enzyme
MNIIRALLNPVINVLEALKLEVQMTRLLMRYPSLRIQRPSNWSFDSFESLDIGENVWVGPFTEIIAFSKAHRSKISGKLILGQGAILAAGCNIRAAGGVIKIGANSGVGQGSVLVAANHAIGPGLIYLRCDWDQQRTGVTVGDNCWIAANCVILPGVTIGDNSIIGAGSVVNKAVPANEVWAGVPARFIKKVA